MTRTPYTGTSRKLVLAFDIGTTFSGAAYAFLDPGEVPQINSVTKYLDNPNAGSTKVPSILYYDKNGNFRGVENGTGLQEDESLLQMRWWKLMIGPTQPSAELKKHMSTSLPRGKTIIDVFSDFISYLFKSTRTLFVSSDPNAESRWNSVSHKIELVLTHPNGWGGPQQNQLRTAAVQAGIVPDTQEGLSRVHFVTEGEASFNFCVTHTRAGEDMKLGDKVLIVDAGGGTIDISSYSVLNGAPLQVEELFRPKCLLQGGEFVTARAKEMLQEKLGASKLNTPEDISAFAQKFDEGVKRVFSDDKVPQWVRFGGPRDHDPQHGIKGGRLMLQGKQVSGFFEPSIQSTVDYIRENFTEILSMDSFAFLVGGFASSPWLYKQLNERLSNLGLRFFKPDVNTDKAVAVGAVSFYIDHFVTGRISIFTYGIPCEVVYRSSNPEHVKREHKSYIDIEGDKCISDGFHTMLSKVWSGIAPIQFTLLTDVDATVIQGTKVLESSEIRTRVHTVREGAPPTEAMAPVTKYDGNQREPQWVDIERDKFETLCYVVADISAAPYTVKAGRLGKRCYTRDYDVVLLVGLTELKAQIRWTDYKTGVEKSGDATVVYEGASENSRTNSRVVPRSNAFDPDF